MSNSYLTSTKKSSAVLDAILLNPSADFTLKGGSDATGTGVGVGVGVGVEASSLGGLYPLKDKPNKNNKTKYI